MSEPTGIEQQPVVATPTDTQPAETPQADNPAWAPFLDGVPSGLHDMMKGRLREWDTGVNERFQKVHSEYEPYKWAKENKIDGQQLQNAYAFYEQANNNPRFVYDEIAKAYGFGNEPQQGQQANLTTPNDEVDLNDFAESGSAFDIENHPAFKAMQEQNANLMRQFEERAQQEQQAANNAEAQSWVDSTATMLESKYPNVPVDQVFNIVAGMMNANPNQDPDALVEQVAQSQQAFIDKIRSTPSPGASAPTVLSPTGGVPVAQNPASYSDSQRKSAAVEFLKAANASN